MPAHYTIVDTAKIGVTTESSLDRATTSSARRARRRHSCRSRRRRRRWRRMTDALRLLARPPDRAPRAPVRGARRRRARTASTPGSPGLFARRLAGLRRSRTQQATGRLSGRLRVGRGRAAGRRRARPSRPRRSRPSSSDAVDGPVVTYADNGGFVHAPSLPHAVTAAVLRNAYLTHAEPARADRMSVNLSSARVRTALRVHRRPAERAGAGGAARVSARARACTKRHPRRRARQVHLRAARALSADLEEADADARTAVPPRSSKRATSSTATTCSTSSRARRTPTGFGAAVQDRRRSAHDAARRRRSRTEIGGCAIPSTRSPTSCWPRACTRSCRATTHARAAPSRR